MSRVLRHQQPGCVFHITSRTQGRTPWFTEAIRGVIAETISDGVASAGATLIAYAIMPNHVHVILAQGRRTLGWTMQPILRRIALLVHRTHSTVGHVFERRFRSKACTDADYLRTAVLYTHFNPVRAGLSGSVHEYDWTSHRAYCSEGEIASGIQVEDALRLFARNAACTDRADLRRDYLSHVDWWQWTHHPSPAAPDQPFAASGNAFFEGRFCTLLDQSKVPATADLRDHAERILSAIDRECEMSMLQGSFVGRHRSAVRRQLIAALLTADYPGTAIANYLKISPSVVSRVSGRMRRDRPRGIADGVIPQQSNTVRYSAHRSSMGAIPAS